MSILAIVILSLLYLFFLIVFFKFFKPVIISPAYIFVLFNLANIVLSILYFYLYDDKFSIANVDDIDAEMFWLIIQLFLFANVAFLIGLLFYHGISSKSIKRLYATNLNEHLFIRFNPKAKLMGYTFVLTFIILLFYLIVYGKQLYVRAEYIPKFELKFLITIAKILSLINAILLGLIRVKKRSYANISIFLIVLFTFATGSRVTFLILMLYFLISFQTSGNTLRNKLKFFFQLVFSFIFLSYIVSIRQIPFHGIRPYIATLFKQDSEILKSVAFNIYYSLIFGVFATSKTLIKGSPDWYYIYVSLNPLPGRLVNWQEVAQELKITKFMPFTLHGQVFEMGYTFTLFFFIMVGNLFGYFEKNVRKFLAKNKRNSAMFFALLMALFVFYSFEYHLRSAFRYFYYAFFFLFVFWAVKSIRNIVLYFIRRSKTPTPEKQE